MSVERPPRGAGSAGAGAWSGGARGSCEFSGGAYPAGASGVRSRPAEAGRPRAGGATMRPRTPEHSGFTPAPAGPVAGDPLPSRSAEAGAVGSGGSRVQCDPPPTPRDRPRSPRTRRVWETGRRRRSASPPSLWFQADGGPSQSVGRPVAPPEGRTRVGWRDAGGARTLGPRGAPRRHSPPRVNRLHVSKLPGSGPLSRRFQNVRQSSNGCLPTSLSGGGSEKSHLNRFLPHPLLPAPVNSFLSGSPAREGGH